MLGTPKAFVDLDDVIVDFNGGALKLHGIDKDSYELPGARFGDDTWKISERNGIEERSFWNHMGYDFWSGLKKTREADDIIEFLFTCFASDQICFLSAPCPGHARGCMEGKRDWVHYHYPKIPLMVSLPAEGIGKLPPKWMMSEPNALLVDDHTPNIDRWRLGGGHGFLFPRPWNRDHALSEYGLEMMMNSVDYFFQERSHVQRTS